jgi:hypothetical protein
MTDYSTETLSPRERELLKKLVDAQHRISLLERKVAMLEAKIKETRLKGESPDQLKASLKHARKQLADYERAEPRGLSHWLSKEEWAHIQELRHRCE